jgi:hypothetical protein
VIPRIGFGIPSIKSVATVQGAMMSKDPEDVRWLIFAWIISAAVFVVILLLWNLFS